MIFNKNNTPSYNDIIIDKKYTDKYLANEYRKLQKINVDNNKNTFLCNKVLYHFFYEELLNSKRQNKSSFYDIFHDEDKFKKLLIQVEKRGRGGSYCSKLVECWRINSGSIVMFKSYQSKYIYQKFNATKVLDFCCGWGGRLLGATSLNIDYIGIDTNRNLIEPYKKMIEFIKPTSNVKMIYKNCLEVDFSNLDYDFVLTSPPYNNIEIYSGMKLFIDDDDYYNNFLIPMIKKSIKYIKNGGFVCINISPQIYQKLIDKYNFKECKKEIALKEQKNGKKSDIIYCWT